MNRKKFIEHYTHFIQHAMRLAEKARNEGLLALEEETEDISDEFFKEGVRLIVDGTDGSIVDEIMTHRAAHEKDKHLRLFKTIQKRAVLGMQKGESPFIFLKVLNSYAGLLPKEEQNITDLLLARQKTQYEKDLDAMKDDDDEGIDDEMGIIDPPEAFQFNDIANLNDSSIQMFMREVDSAELAKALMKARNKVKRAVFRNLTKRAGAMLLEDMGYMGPVDIEYIKEAQEKIVSIIRHLQDCGEIP